MLFVLVSLWISTFAATQDIAIDGYTVESLASEDHRLGSMAQSIGVALGSLFGGAGVLWLYQVLGWQSALLTLAGLSALTMLAVVRVDDRLSAQIEAARPGFVATFKRSEIRWALLLILVYRLVEAPAMAMLTPMLVDRQWSLTQIGLLMSVAGASVGLLAAVAAARLLLRQLAATLLLRAGWLRSLAYLAVAGLLLSGLADGSPLWLGTMVLVLLAIRYLAMTSLYALFMQLCSRQQAGTDFTVLVCFELLVFFVGGSLSGFLAKGLGYETYYLLLGALSVLSVLLCKPIVRSIQAGSDNH